MSKKKETVGKISLDLSQKVPESRDPIEIQREMQQDYLKELVMCVESNKNIIPGDFFIVVITKNERLMPNVFRNYFFARNTCPTPDYDQSVFMYKRTVEEIEYIWTIPSRDACIHLKENALLVAPEERHLLDFILQFSDGSLYKLARKLNAEVENPSIIAKG
jgi:hypothetical protein